MAHSKIGASSYQRWKACPGSVKLSENIEQTESVYAKAGTLAHEIAAAILKHTFFQEDMATWPNQYPDDETRAVKRYVEIVRAEAKGVFPKDIKIEHQFDIGSVYPGLFGTCDAVIYKRDLKKLIVIDYKHGSGIPVEVENNLQLMYYALGALVSTGVPCDEVELVIVQPRCNHPGGEVRRSVFKSLELIDFAEQLAEDAKATEAKDAPLNPGKHCRFCPAAAVKCPAVHEKALALAKIHFAPEQKYDPQQLTKALDFLPALEAWIAQVRQFAYEEAQKGRIAPGYKLVNKRATRKWKLDEKKTVESLEALLPRGIELYSRALLSPAQIEKQVGRKYKNVVDELTEKISTGTKLVPENEEGEKYFAGSEFTQQIE